MNNETQLAKWREEFESLYTGKNTLERYPDGRYKTARIQWTWVGFLRAKQENEQALKDARKQAIEETLAVLHQTYKSTADELAAINELLK